MPFAVIVESKEVRGIDRVVTKRGTRFWALVEPQGWVAATSREVNDPKQPPADVKTFPTREGAERFAKKWDGHPWWCKPNGFFEIVPVVPRMVTVQQGWEILR